MPATDHIQARTLNRIRHAVEDFDDAGRNLAKMGLVFGGLALIMFASRYTGAENTAHGFYSMAGAGGLLMIFRLDLLRRGTLLAVTLAFGTLLLAEWTLFGWPEEVFRDLMLEEPGRVPTTRLSVGLFITMAFNLASPYLYWGLKIFTGLVLARAWWRYRVVREQDEFGLRWVLGERFGAM